MLQGPWLVLVSFLGILFIVFATAKWKLHPFLSLFVASFAVGVLFFSCDGIKTLRLKEEVFYSFLVCFLRLLFIDPY
ncbi:hypothetical protein [Paludifilum halophilum]|nr:hypothetical protein [Paludifilum halophilum]